MKLLRKRKRPKVKRSKYKGLKCGSSKELRFLKEQERFKRPIPTKAKRIKTPFGFYTPDFEYPTYYIEIKGLHTFLVCLGYKNYIGKGKLSTLQWDKIKWVAKFVKPVCFVVYLSRREKLPTLVLNEPGVSFVFKGGYKPKKTLKCILYKKKLI